MIFRQHGHYSAHPVITLIMLQWRWVWEKYLLLKWHIRGWLDQMAPHYHHHYLFLCHLTLVWRRTYVIEPPQQTLIACLSTGEESDNICVISTWWRAPREPAQKMIWVELSTINRLITTGWFSPSKPSLHRLIQIHPLWGHSCPRQSNCTTPTPNQPS